jgi:hypothetical protein
MTLRLKWDGKNKTISTKWEARAIEVNEEKI